MAAALSFVIVRHGEATHNVMAEAAREAGLDPDEAVYSKWWARDTLLTENGRRAAAGRAAASPDIWARPSSPDTRVVFVCSPLRRCIETAAISIGTAIGTTASQDGSHEHEHGDGPWFMRDGHAFRFDERLRERCAGHGCNAVCSDWRAFACRAFEKHTGFGRIEDPNELEDRDSAWTYRESEDDLRCRAAMVVRDAVAEYAQHPDDSCRHTKFVLITHHEMARALAYILRDEHETPPLDLEPNGHREFRVADPELGTVDRVLRTLRNAPGMHCGSLGGPRAPFGPCEHLSLKAILAGTNGRYVVSDPWHAEQVSAKLDRLREIAKGFSARNGSSARNGFSTRDGVDRETLAEIRASSLEDCIEKRAPSSWEETYALRDAHVYQTVEQAVASAVLKLVRLGLPEKARRYRDAYMALCEQDPRPEWPSLFLYQTMDDREAADIVGW